MSKRMTEIKLDTLEWEEVKIDDLTGIYNIGWHQPYISKYSSNNWQHAGYNGILKGDLVIYDNNEYTVVMVSRMGDFGLSNTGDLPYSIRVFPKDVTKITE